jgi:hypothetical protein
LGKKSYWQHIRPVGAIADFRAVFEGAGRHRWRFMALAAGMTFLVFSLITHEETRIPPRPPHIDYITSWHANRTDAEIIAGNIANEKRKERLAAEQAQRDEMVRGIYKTIGRVSGMDVDAIERQGRADAAADAKAEAAREAKLYPTGNTPTPTPAAPASPTPPAP